MGQQLDQQYEKQGEGRRYKAKARHRGRNVLIVILSVILLLAAGVGVYATQLAGTFNSQSQKLDQAFPEEAGRPTKVDAPGTDAQNILLLGSDSLGPSLDAAVAGSSSDQRSDSMIWVHVPADRKNIYMMSVMRDTWVDIPGHGQAKINAAMAYGGIPLVVQTLEGLFKTRVDHVAVVDLEGFRAMTDALGGVQVNVPTSFTSSSGVSFKAGVQTLNGVNALAFVRERHAFADGDYQRARNQQTFLKAAMSRFLTAETLTNPLRVQELVKSTSPYISVDKSLDATAIGGLAFELRDVRPANVLSFTLPNKGVGTSADGQSIVIADPASMDEIGTAFRNETLGSYLEKSGLANQK